MCPMAISAAIPVLGLMPLRPVRWRRSMRYCLAAFKDGMLGNDIAEVENADQVGQLVDLDAPAGAMADVRVAQ